MFRFETVKVLSDWEKRLFLTKDLYPDETIRQSGLSLYRECGKKFKVILSTGRRGNTPFTFGGSVLHSAVEDRFNNPSNFLKHSYSPEYWAAIMNRHSKDCPTDFDSLRFAHLLSKHDTLKGITAGEIIDKFANFMLDSLGLEFIEAEKHLVLNIHGCVPYTGTIDLVFKRGDSVLIIDTKTSGFMKPFINGRAPAKQSWDKEQVSFMPQLRHYHWLGWRSGEWDAASVKRYGIFSPTNMCPQLTGKSKGSPKGAPLFWSVPIRKHIAEMYEQDLCSWINKIRLQMYTREYPSVYGKISCPSCIVKDICFNDEVAVAKPSFIPSGR